MFVVLFVLAFVIAGGMCLFYGLEKGKPPFIAAGGLLAFTGLIIAMILGVSYMERRQDEQMAALIQQCMQESGKGKWDCYAILKEGKGNPLVIPFPIVVPSR